MELPNPAQQLASGLQTAFTGAVGGVQRACIGLQQRFEEHQRTQRYKRIIVPPRAGLGASKFAAILPGDSLAEQVLTTGTINFLNLYNSALIVRLVLTWFPNPPAFIEQPLSTVCDPYLNLFRGIIPPLGGTLDFSPILAFVVLNFFTSSAAALPCELGPDGRTPVARQQQQRSNWSWMQPSKFQAAWQQRVATQRALRQVEAAAPPTQA